MPAFIICLAFFTFAITMFDKKIVQIAVYKVFSNSRLVELANSTSLELENTLYTAICTIFLSNIVIAKVKNARHIIKAGILERQQTLNELKEILSEFELNVHTLDFDFTDINEEEVT